MLRVLYPIPNAFKSLSKRRLIGIDRKNEHPKYGVAFQKGSAHASL